MPIFFSFKETSYLCLITSPYFPFLQFVSQFAVFTSYYLQGKRRKAITIPKTLEGLASIFSTSKTFHGFVNTQNTARKPIEHG